MPTVPPPRRDAHRRLEELALGGVIRGPEALFLARILLLLGRATRRAARRQVFAGHEAGLRALSQAKSLETRWKLVGRRDARLVIQVGHCEAAQLVEEEKFAEDNGESQRSRLPAGELRDNAPWLFA